MAQRNDLEFAWLRSAGYTGALPDMRAAFFKVEGISTWREYYNQNGGTGHISDWLFELFGGAGPGPGPGPGDDPAWEAVTADPTTYEMLEQRIGSGTPTFTSSEMLLPDYEGVYYAIPANTAPWHRARVVTNYAYDSQDFSTRWDKGGASTAVTYGSPDPDGGATALRLTAVAGEEWSFTDLLATTPYWGYPIFSIWLKSNTGGNQTVRLGGGQLSGDITVTDTWQRFAQVSTIQYTSWGRFGVYRGVADNENNDILMWHPHFEGGPSGLTPPTAPSEYVENVGIGPTSAAYANRNGNTVSNNNVVTEAVGQPIAELPSLYAAPAVTNLVLHSNNFTDAVWVPTALTAALDQIGITGEPNTASLLTASADTTQARTNQAVTLTAGSQTIRVFAKAGSVNWLRVYAQNVDPSLPQAFFDLNNIALGTVGEGTAAIDEIGDWVICYFEFSTTTNLNGTVYVQLSPSDGSTSVLSGDTLTVGNVEVFSGLTIAEVRGAAPIITAGATVSNAAVDLNYSRDNMGDGVNGAYFVETKLFAPDSGAGFGFIVKDNSNRMNYIGGTDRQEVSAREGGDTVISPASADWNTLTHQKSATVYDLNAAQFAANAEGSYSADGVYEGGFVATSGFLNVLAATNAGAIENPALIRNIQRWDLAYADAKTKVDELMSTPSWPPPLDAPVFDANLVWAAVGSSYSMSENGGGDYKMEAQLIGSGSPTFTSSKMLLPDHEGVYRTIPANTAPWHGARIVTNYCQVSNDITNSRWIKSNVVIATGITDPDGGNTAFTVTASGGVGALYNSPNSTQIIDGNRVNSIWLKRRTGSGNIGMYTGSSTSQITVPVTNEWQRFTVSSGPDISAARCGIRIAVDGDEVDFWHPLLEVPLNQSDPPSEYVENPNETASAVAAYQSTNGNTVSNNVVTENIGVPIDEQPSLYAAPAMTNLFTYSNDLTNAAWAPSGVTVTLDQVGITGEPNTATLMAATGGAEARVIRNGVGVSVGGPMTVVTYIKKRTLGEWNKIALYDYDGGVSDGAISLWVNAANGTIGTTGTQVTAAIDEVGDWFVVYYEQTTTTDLGGSFVITAIDGDNSNTSVAGHQAVIGNLEFYENTTIAEVRGAAPIITAGATVSNVATELNWDVANAPVATSEGCIYHEATELSGGNSSVGMHFGTGGGDYVVKSQPANSTAVITYIDTTDTTRAITTAPTGAINIDPSKYGAAWGGSDMYGSFNGSTSEATQSDYKSLRTGSRTKWGPFRNSALLIGVVLIRNVQRWDLAYAAAKAKIDELMGGG